jgi:AcrR family transcriptional regulator
MFVEQGYFAVSIRDIAKAADLTNGAVYGHFRSKGQLLVQVIRWKHTERDHAIDFATAAQPMRGIDFMYDKLGRDVRLLEVDAAAAARHDIDVRTGMTELSHERLQHIEQAVESVASDPRALAWFITTMGVGIGLRESAGLRSPSVKRMRETVSAAFGGVLDLGR